MKQTGAAKFWHDPLAKCGSCGIALLLLPAIAAPLLANGRPLAQYLPETGISFPFLRYLFAPDSTEFLIEQFFNYLLLFGLGGTALFFLPGRRWTLPFFALLLLVPFFLTPSRVDKTDYRALVRERAGRALFAPVPYGPNEIVAEPYQTPSKTHWFGTDEVGRSVAARMIYGARVSLAVGVIATAAALAIGTVFGLLAGYFGGWFDLTLMRLVEILLCFPTFLLLLILMSIFKDRKFEQSILIVIAVLALTGWIGLAFLVRGEVFKQCALPYVQSCTVAGIPVWRTLFIHVLPNIVSPILISFTFGVAGAILAESSLSFLGFGVQPPTASWGGLLRQAFDNPLGFWHLTLFPGLALFWAVLAFNFTGEGLRKAFSAREE